MFHHNETSQFICLANQVTGLLLIKILLVNMLGRAYFFLLLSIPNLNGLFQMIFSFCYHTFVLKQNQKLQRAIIGEGYGILFIQCFGFLLFFFLILFFVFCFCLVYAQAPKKSTKKVVLTKRKTVQTNLSLKLKLTCLTNTRVQNRHVLLRYLVLSVATSIKIGVIRMLSTKVSFSHKWLGPCHIQDYLSLISRQKY